MLLYKHPFTRFLVSSPQKKFVAYYRVSTQKQGRSGLGLNAQRNTVRKYVQKKGSVIQEFTEVESGRNRERPELNGAVAFCKKNKATLLLATLDRLARSVSFIFAIKDAGVKIECCDLPDLNTLNLGIFATLAQY
ncbi:MAG: recombinase family protein, partial [Bacteroidetes bacterium]|nr:recombinase family protein [Bacteroidota bacterium]